jgi:hypothetical protein
MVNVLNRLDIHIHNHVRGFEVVATGLMWYGALFSEHEGTLCRML